MEKLLQENYLKYEQQYKMCQKKYHQITWFRFAVLITIILFAFYTFKTSNYYLLIPSLIGIILFFLFLKIDTQIIFKKNKFKKLQEINANEITFLATNKSTYANGQEYIAATHLYTNDLDVFGINSLYQYLNRTGTVMGANSLANALIEKQPLVEITKNQEAAKELSTKTAFRQEVLALAQLANDDKAKYAKIMEWCKTNFKPLPKAMAVLIYILPILLISVIVLLNVSTIPNLGWVATFLFVLNTYIASLFGKQLIQIIGSTEKVNESIYHYATCIQLIENTNFTSVKMQELQQTLKHDGVIVSSEVKKLGKIIANIESIQNVFGALLANGFTFFHLHQLNALNKWKNTYNQQMESWLSVVGEVEKLNSFANLAANNPTFVFPTFNTSKSYAFENLGHPLLHPNKRVCNTITLKDKNFIILSGSNMSGKSTFLRTVGVNIILANAGAPICATSAIVSHLPLVSCMRLSDSLEESESYFFAEVKRLHQIIEANKKETCFVLLDEILRGTNSEDKKQGTMQVIEKLLQQNAVGVIATHDIEVCTWGETAHPAIGLFCFENEIINNELFFDYKLKQGICKNKSATFLLQKMNVI